MTLSLAPVLDAGETYSVSVPGEQYWRDGHIQADAGGYSVHYDAVDGCWVRQAVMEDGGVKV